MAKDNYYEDFNDFIIFLYLYMAQADGFIDPREEKVIMDKLRILYPGNAHLDKVYQTAKEAFLALDSREYDQIINFNFEKHTEKSFTYKYKIFTDLYEIIIADGVIAEEESKSMKKLKTLIEKNLKT